MTALQLATAAGELALFDCAGFDASLEILQVLRGEKHRKDCVQLARFVESLEFIHDLGRTRFKRLGYEYLFSNAYIVCTKKERPPEAFVYVWLGQMLKLLKKISAADKPDETTLAHAEHFCSFANLSINTTREQLALCRF